VRYLAIAALAATFWLLVATVRLMFSAPAPTAVVLLQGSPERRLEPRAAAPIGERPKCNRPYHGSDDDDPFEPGRDNPISKAAVVKGFNAVRPQVADCYRKFQVPGLAMVNVVIARSGGVSQAVVTGKFAGTPTGACVEAAVKAARFPASDGLSAPYPFQLR